MSLQKKMLIGVVSLSVACLCGASYEQYKLLNEYIEINNESQQMIKNLESANKGLLGIIKEHEAENAETISELSGLIDRLTGQIHKLENDILDMHEYCDCNNENIVFDASNIKTPSGAGVCKMKKILKDTVLYDYAEAYVLAEKEYGVNAIALAAITAHESDWGESDRAKRTNNLSGYAVYTSASNGKTFPSPSVSIIETAKLLSEEYLRTDGKWYNGLSIKDVNTKYCYGSDNKPDYNWSESITSIGHAMADKANN